jgi:hypothetical protein
MRLLIICLGSALIFTSHTFSVLCTSKQPPSLVGRWKVKFTLREMGEHSLRLDAEPSGKGTLLLLDNRSSLVEPAKPTEAEWSQTQANQVAFSGKVEFPIGNVGRLAGILVFKGTLDSDDSLSGNVSLFQENQNVKDPAAVPSQTGKFTAKRITEKDTKDHSAGSFF